MKRPILIAMLFMHSYIASAQSNYFQLYNDSASLKKDNDAMISDFETIIKKIEPSFRFNGLTTEIPHTFMPGQYRYKTNKIYHVTWQIGGPPMENFLTQMAGTKTGGEKMAATFFYGFFFPHEIGHALHYNTNNVPQNKYDSEYEANVIAVLYWRKKGKQKELQQCLKIAKSVLEKIESPIPPNTDTKKFITEHYADLMKDPLKYSYIQFTQIVEILEDKSLPKLETYLKKYFAKKG